MDIRRYMANTLSICLPKPGPRISETARKADKVVLEVSIE